MNIAKFKYLALQFYGLWKYVVFMTSDQIWPSKYIVCNFLLFSCIGTPKSTLTCSKLNTLLAVEIEFAKVTEKIRRILNTNTICIASLIQKLCAVSSVKNKNVPLFDNDVFEKVTDIDELWKMLRKFWNFFDHDLLILVVELTESSEARVELDNFLDKIDFSALQHQADFLLHYRQYKPELEQPVLRVKVNIEKCDIDNYKKAKKVLSAKFNLEDYSLCCIGIKEGCIEIMFWVSEALMSYLLHFELSKENGNDLAVNNIICLQLNGMVMFVPKNSTAIVSKYIQ